MITHEGRGRKTSPRRHAPDSSPEMWAFLNTPIDLAVLVSETCPWFNAVIRLADLGTDIRWVLAP